jgi:predicted  nucleic acid-binding Zn-ribbon protein
LALLQRLSNGSIDPDSDVQRVLELQETLDKQNTELTAARTKIAELTSRIKELEDAMTSSAKEHAKAQEQCSKLQRDLREVRRERT